MTKGFISSEYDTIYDGETRRVMDQATQFTRLNIVRHYVISRRSIYRSEDCDIETTETYQYQRENISSGLG